MEQIKTSKKLKTRKLVHTLEDSLKGYILHFIFCFRQAIEGCVMEGGFRPNKTPQSFA
jgi:hypothetical protein